MEKTQKPTRRPKKGYNGTYNIEVVVGGGWVGARDFFGEVAARRQERIQRRRRRCRQGGKTPVILNGGNWHPQPHIDPPSPPAVTDVNTSGYRCKHQRLQM